MFVILIIIIDMTYYTKPPQIPYIFKPIGIILFFLSVTFFILFYNYKSFLEISELAVDKFYLGIRMSFILSTFLILFSKEKTFDERLLQFKLITMAHGLLVISLAYFMGLLMKLLFNQELQFYLDPTFLLIIGNISAVYSFYSNKKDY